MTYNSKLLKIKCFVDSNPGKTMYQIAKKIGADPRTVKDSLSALNTLGLLREERVEVGGKEHINYFSEEGGKSKMTKNGFLSDFLDVVLNQRNGYRFGELWRHTDKSLGGVMPILMDAERDDREYVMIEEVKDKEVVTISDSGSINRVKVKSESKKPVFVRMGTAFSGATQTRAADTSVIIMPEAEEQEIPVKCVYASKGINAGAVFQFAGSTPHDVEMGFVSGAGQHGVWNRVSCYSARQMSLASAHGARLEKLGTRDDLMGTMKKVKEFKKKSVEILKKIPCLENQVGCVIFDSKGVLSLETFDHPASWKAFHMAIYEKYEDILTEEQSESLFELKKSAVPKLVEAFITDMKSAEMVELKKESKGKFDYVTYGLKNSSFGELTTLNGKIIHVLGLRKDNGNSSESESEGVLRPWNMHPFGRETSDNYPYGGTPNGWSHIRDRGRPVIVC